MENSEEDSCHVYLEFNEKLTPAIFANKMFLRIANLHKPNPLVQINDLLFRGSYDECVGTNLFFEEIEDPPVKTNIFDKNPAIRLKPTISQTKLIKLKQVKLPRNASSNKQCKESIVLNLNQDYNTVLEKIEQGILNIDDIAHKEPEHTLVEQFEDMTFETSEDISTEPEREIDTLLAGVENRTPGAQLEAKYERLKRLVRRPVKRMKSPELVEECDPEYRDAFEYHNLERQICQNSDTFRSVSCPIIEKSFVGGIDIDRCVLQGLLPASTDVDHVLTPEQQRKVFTVDNFENLSLPGRYLVLKECVTQIEESIESSTSDDLKETDDNGRTIADICDIFRRLVRALEQVMAQGVESDDVNVTVRTELSDRAAEEYVKYRYDPKEWIESSDIFNYDEWIESGAKKTEEKSGEQESVADSDESMEEDP